MTGSGDPDYRDEEVARILRRIKKQVWGRPRVGAVTVRNAIARPTKG